jgi:hypothetical protein
MNKTQINKDFEILVKSQFNKGVVRCDENEYKNLLEWASINNGVQAAKKTDYGFYIITFLIIFFVVVILLIIYYTEKIVTDSLNSLIDDKNKSNYINIEEYDAEELSEL